MNEIEALVQHFVSSLEGKLLADPVGYDHPANLGSIASGGELVDGVRVETSIGAWEVFVNFTPKGHA